MTHPECTKEKTVGSTVAQDNLPDSALHIARNAVEVESRTTSRQCVSQHGSNIRTSVAER